MKSLSSRFAILVPILLSPTVLSAQVIDELDDYWAEMSRAVEEGDFEAYGRLYHPEAVLVDLGSGRSYPIERALGGWEQGFRDTGRRWFPPSISKGFLSATTGLG